MVTKEKENQLDKDIVKHEQMVKEAKNWLTSINLDKFSDLLTEDTSKTVEKIRLDIDKKLKRINSQKNLLVYNVYIKIDYNQNLIEFLQLIDKYRFTLKQIEFSVKSKKRQ